MKRPTDIILKNYPKKTVPILRPPNPKIGTNWHSLPQRYSPSNFLSYIALCGISAPYDTPPKRVRSPLLYPIELH